MLLVLAAALCAAGLVTGCNSAGDHRWLTVFFDGVPPVGGTNALPTYAAVSASTPAPVTAVAPVKAVPAEPSMYFHPPFAEQKCTDCHASGTGMGLQMRPPALCFTCHKDFLAGTKFQHQPVSDGDCTSCHDPHQSPLKHLLLKKGTDLCLTCHDDPGAEGKFKHSALDSAECLDCHAPHATNFKSLLKKSVKDTCAD